ncbi:hypothetical protein MPL3365_70491 [Mesorhizobium plurifarium]|uniref:Uncharacterized protein n=1 Tax=Mesorhizobium plurifarium TaxID=69974 RepID=A0A090GW64_MESPL|nr:hypothetical protein MPL3365_70491 [Mesorhizobium plurifarium]
MPLLRAWSTAEQNLHRSGCFDVTAWILGSAPRRFAPAPPVDDEAIGILRQYNLPPPPHLPI